MAATLNRSEKAAPPALWRELPPIMRVLYITNRQRTGGWLAEAFAADSASEVVLDEAVGSAAGLARLRDETFDAVLVSHEPGELDAMDLIEGYRAGGADEPIVILGNQSEQEMAALCYEVGADGYVCAHTTTTRNLIWILARAIQRHQLIRENRRLNVADRQRLQREHEEAERLLAEQRTLISDLEAMRQRGAASAASLQPKSLPAEAPSAGPRVPCGSESRPPIDLPPELVRHYRELLRTYVIMGSGNLAAELSQLADLLTAAGVTARQTMHLHLCVLEELVHGLGTRSTRHVMTRGDLLALEILMYMAEGYRQRYRERTCPPVQRALPGFEPPSLAAA